MSGRNPRLWYGLGAVGAAAVATVFSTVGDGVSVPEASGLRGLVVEHAHTVTWVLLAAALAAAAVSRSWSRLAGGLAIAAGACYLAFSVAVFLLR